MTRRTLHIDPSYQRPLAALGLTSLENFFAFEGGESLHKENLAAHRSRAVFDLPGGPRVFLKRYVNTPRGRQLRNWIAAGRRVAVADLDRLPAEELARHDIKTPKIIAWGSEWDGLWETRSFILTEQIPGGVSLERQLPECLSNLHPLQLVRERKDFLRDLARWVRRFHDTGLRHRDLYLAHIFLDEGGDFVLIDLHRCFAPRLFGERWLIKDLTQLYYSAPGQEISRADRLRFYLDYTGKDKLSPRDRRRLHRIKRRAWTMADHDIRHSRAVPFAQ